ncbi:hypothetical protein [Arthrobacter sp. NPDC056493]|uniref:hypothetical protein n=1 Tax=Arthrobacter sp. NPDC056493 TaxID=3345839 RepID=UPI00366B96F2
MISWILQTAPEQTQNAGDFAPVYANIVATVALILAGLSLLWQYLTGRRDRPLVSISGQCSVTMDGQEPRNPKWQLDVHLANTGHKAASVKEVAWQIETSKKTLIPVVGGPLDPTVPMKLEGLDTETWSMEIPIHGTKWKGLRGRPYAKVVKRLNWIQRLEGFEVESTLVGDWCQMEYEPEWFQLPTE